MKKMILIIMSLFLLTGCHVPQKEEKDIDKTQNIETNVKGVKHMILAAGNHQLVIEMENNKSVDTLTSLLPVELSLAELNGNEYYCELDNSLNAKDQEIGTIHKGDVMLYGGNTIVFFYKTFKTNYRYTRLGRIKETSQLEKILKENSDVTLKKEDK